MWNGRTGKSCGHGLASAGVRVDTLQTVDSANVAELKSHQVSSVSAVVRPSPLPLPSGPSPDQKSAYFAHFIPKYPSRMPASAASAIPSLGQRHRTERSNDATRPKNIRPIGLDLTLSSDSPSNAWMPPNKKPKQPNDAMPSITSCHVEFVHGAPCTNAAIAVVAEKKAPSMSAV